MLCTVCGLIGDASFVATLEVKDPENLSLVDREVREAFRYRADHNLRPSDRLEILLVIRGTPEVLNDNTNYGWTSP